MTIIKSYPREHGEEVVIRIWTRKNLEGNKWEIIVSGLPDFEVISNDVDDLKIISRLDASRFKPVIESP